jgi:hypothetical protein
MSKKYMFAEKNGKATEVKVDPKNIERQQRELRAQGYSVTVLDEDERIRYGLLTQQLRRRSS